MLFRNGILVLKAWELNNNVILCSRQEGGRERERHTKYDLSVEAMLTTVV